jgi:hypothetical protein
MASCAGTCPWLLVLLVVETELAGVLLLLFCRVADCARVATGQTPKDIASSSSSAPRARAMQRDRERRLFIEDMVISAVRSSWLTSR